MKPDATSKNSACYPGKVAAAARSKPNPQSPLSVKGEGGGEFGLDNLKKWLKTNLASGLVQDYSEKPGLQSKRYPFVLTSVPLFRLRFYSHAFNPRTPNPGKVNELRASVEQLGLLAPLTCAYVDPAKLPDAEEHPVEPVVLLDGRHRFEALKALRSADPDWAKRAKIDLKIYYGLERSDLYLLATYLNRTRKALARGEYYKVLVSVYEERKRELEETDGQPRTEAQVFKDIRSPSITNLTFDMSVGRIVGLTAFDEEEDKSWYPMVGTRQQERFDPRTDGFKGLRPLTAGNLAVFLGYLCKVGPYKDDGTGRATEISNVIRLGEKFRALHLLTPVSDYDTSTATSVCCKHWCLDAFGSILEESKLLGGQVGRGLSPLSDPDLPWDAITRVLRAYHEIMGEQAEKTNDWKKGKLDYPPWSYQTQREQVKVPLYAEIAAKVPLARKPAK